MHNQKSKSKIIFVLFCLIILTGSLSYGKEDTLDLGETGFTSQAQAGETAKDYLTKSVANNITTDIAILPLKFSYKSSLPKHEGPPVTRHISFIKTPGLPIGTKIFVFSCCDEDCIRIASAVNFDYGLCIEYKSIDDIRDFKKELKLNQPTAMSNNETIKAFGVTSYPALITVRENEFEIQEGF